MGVTAPESLYVGPPVSTGGTSSYSYEKKILNPLLDHSMINISTRWSLLGCVGKSQSLSKPSTLSYNPYFGLNPANTIKSVKIWIILFSIPNTQFASYPHLSSIS